MPFHRVPLQYALSLFIVVTSVSAESASGLYDSGLESLGLGHYAEARESFEAALKAAQGSAAADRALILDRLGDALVGAGDWQGAERAYRHSIEVWAEAPPPRPLASVLPQADLANVFRRLGRLTEAARLHQQAYEAAVALVGENHAEVAGMLNQRAQVAQEMGDYKTAREIYARAVEIWRRIGRDDEPDAAYPLHNLGLLEVRRGAPDQGRAKLERAREVWRRSLPAHHPIFSGSWAALGEASASQGREAEARASFETALEHARTSLGPRHVKVGLLLGRYSAAMRTLGRKKEARRLAAESEEILLAHDGSRQAANTVDVGALGRSLR